MRIVAVLCGLVVSLVGLAMVVAGVLGYLAKEADVECRTQDGKTTLVNRMSPSETCEDRNYEEQRAENQKGDAAVGAAGFSLVVLGALGGIGVALCLAGSRPPVVVTTQQSSNYPPRWANQAPRPLGTSQFTAPPASTPST